MLSPATPPFSTAFYVWLLAGSASGLLFVVGVQQAQLPARGVVAVVGALACLASLLALTVITRHAMSPESGFGAIVVYIFGIGLSLIFSLCYAFFFMFWHAKNF